MTVFEPYESFLGLGSFSEVYLEKSKSTQIQWSDKKIETILSASDSGVGLRFIHHGMTRFGHANVRDPFSGSLPDPEKSQLESIFSSLRRGLPANKIPALKPVVHQAHDIKIHPQTIPLDQKMSTLQKAFEATQIDSKIRQVNINYGEKIKTLGCLNSDGTQFIEDRVYLVMSLTVTAGEKGDLQTAYESVGGITGFELFDEKAVTALANQVAVRALLKLKAPQAPVGEMPVVIAASAGGTLIHEAVGHSLEADAVLEGTSPSYSGKTGQVVANEKLTVFDDPTLPSKRGSFHYDDEGTKSEPSKLIDGGVLKDLMYDRLSAMRAGRKSNGHGRRESYAYKPIPRMSNTLIAPGPDDPDEIVASLKNGLLVTKMGGGQVNTANGDFVFDVEEGFQMRDGKKKMVRGATLLGNGPQVLKDIDLVGTDHGWGIGTCGKEGQGVRCLMRCRRYG